MIPLAVLRYKGFEIVTASRFAADDKAVFDIRSFALPVSIIHLSGMLFLSFGYITGPCMP
jgi:hypothetical protein